MAREVGELGSGPLYAVYRLKLGAGEPPTRFGAVRSGGTCPSTEIFNIDGALSGDAQGGRREVVDPDELVRWAYWGGGDYPVFYQGRYFIVAANLGDVNDVNMISAVRPDGNIVPMCLLHEGTRRSEPTAAAQTDVCAEITNGTARPLDWGTAREGPSRDLDAAQPAVLDELFGQNKHDGDGEVLTVDVQNTGRPVLLGRTIYDSGAGCGSHSERLRVVPERLADLNIDPLDGFFETLTGNFNEFYVLDGTTYLHVSTGSTSDELLALHGTRVETICRWNRHKEVERMLELPTASAFAIAVALSDNSYSCKYDGLPQEMNACALGEFNKAVERLQHTYRLVVSNVGSARRGVLRTEQHHWLAERDLMCKPRARVSEGGSIWPVEYFACLRSATERRIQELGVHRRTDR